MVRSHIMVAFLPQFLSAAVMTNAAVAMILNFHVPIKYGFESIEF
jgi:hypothetical protein